MNNATALRSNINVVIPKASKLPAGIEMLATVASLEFCPVKSVSQRVRADYIMSLIDSELLDRGI